MDIGAIEIALEKLDSLQALGNDVLAMAYGRPRSDPGPALSARDEFAKAAMQSTMTVTSSDATRAEVAQRAYAMADAMMKARGA